MIQQSVFSKLGVSITFYPTTIACRSSRGTCV